MNVTEVRYPAFSRNFQFHRRDPTVHVGTFLKDSSESVFQQAAFKIRFLERVGDSDEKNFTSVKEFIADTVKSVTEPEQPRLTIIFQWNPEVEFTSNDFTDNLLDACNYKILCAIQGKGEIGVKLRVKFGNFSENCEKLDAVENMTDEGSCIRLRSLICALKGAQRDDIEQMKEVITGIIPQVSLYFVQAYELWLAAESRNEVTLDLEPNDDLSLGSFSFLPIDAPHDQINEEIYR